MVVDGFEWIENERGNPMYSVLSLGALGMLVAAVQILRSSKRERVMNVLFAILYVGIGGFIGLLASMIFEANQPVVTRESGRFPLAAMRTTDGVTGIMVWGSGSIGSQSIYRVYLRNGDGSVSPYSIVANLNVRIIEDEKLEAEGTMITRQEVKDPSWEWANWTTDSGRLPPTTYELRVPKGTVKHEFKAQ